VNRLVSNIILAFCFIFIICFPTTSYAQEAWDTLETDCCTIFYFDEGHLEDFALRIDAVKYTSNGYFLIIKALEKHSGSFLSQNISLSLFILIKQSLFILM
jgi:hypothetical protein